MASPSLNRAAGIVRTALGRTCLPSLFATPTSTAIRCTTPSHSSGCLSLPFATVLTRHLTTVSHRAMTSMQTASSKKPSQAAAAAVRDAFINPLEGKDQDIFRDFSLPTGAHVDDRNAHVTFRETVNYIFREYRPSRHTFFQTLANVDAGVVKDRRFLAAFYARYQACMHATRAAVYFAPHLNTPSLRQRKIAIILDDDSNSHDSHHVQLYKLFLTMGCTESDLLSHDIFGDSDQLARRFSTVDGAYYAPAIGTFIEHADRLYREDTGAWCIAEVLSDDWLSALAKAFAAHSHLAHVPTQPYFDEILVGNVEIQHMLATVAMTEEVLVNKPELLPQVLTNMVTMAKQLNALWTDLEELVKEHARRVENSKSVQLKVTPQRVTVV